MRAGLVIVVVGSAVLLAALPMVGARLMGPEAEAAGTGPQLGFGTVSVVSGKVEVPVVSTGISADSYSGFNIHLRFDPSVFSFDSATSSGGVLGGSVFCPPSVVDGDGMGVVFACTALGSGTTNPGLLGTIRLSPVGTGCSALHLFTFGGADGGDSNTGTYTVNEADFTVQANTYGSDTAANQAGASCSIVGTATPTPTATETATPSSTATASSTATSTVAPPSGSPDVIVSAFGVPSSTDSGGIVSLSMVVSNLGGGAANGVKATIALPAGAVPVLSAACKTYSAGNFSCQLPNLAANDNSPGGSDQSGVIAMVQMPIILANAAVNLTITASAANEPIAVVGNNSAQVLTNLSGCGDLDGDNHVTILDMSTAAASFLKGIGDPGYNPLADQNGDQFISITDLAAIASRYLESCKGLDADHDGVSNYDEINVYLTDPFIADTDGDGLNDGVEILSFGSDPFSDDTDGDRYDDAEEAAIGETPVLYCLTMAADLDHDGFVNTIDLTIAAASYLKLLGDPGYNVAADINGDDVVNILDFSLMAQRYLQSVVSCP